jgi:hypothetical protein
VIAAAAAAEEEVVMVAAVAAAAEARLWRRCRFGSERAKICLLRLLEVEERRE